MFSRALFGTATGAVAIALGIAAGTAHAQDTKVINVATDPSYPPLEYKDPATNKLIGFDIDLFEAVAAKIGLKVNWIEVSWEQMMASIKTKRVDVLATAMQISPERRATVNFVEYLRDGAQVMTLRTNAARLPDIESLCGKRVANRRAGGIYGPELAKWSDQHCTKTGKPAVISVDVANSADSRQQLNQGRADAAVISTLTLAYQNKVEGNRYVAVGKPYYYTQVGYAYSKDNPQLGDALKIALLAVISDGTYQKLLSKWELTDSAIPREMIGTGH